MGIHLIQGFLLGRPNPFPAADLSALDSATSVGGGPVTFDSGYLGHYVAPLAPDASLGDAWKILQSLPSIFALPVVDNGRPLGLLHKWRVMEFFSSTYSRAFHCKKPVSSLMARDALVVEHDEPLEAVSQSLLEGDLYYLKQHFIVTRGGHYIGLGSTRALLGMMTRRWATPAGRLQAHAVADTEEQRH